MMHTHLQPNAAKGAQCIPPRPCITPAFGRLRCRTSLSSSALHSPCCTVTILTYTSLPVCYSHLPF